MASWLPTSLDFLLLQARRRSDAGGLRFRDERIPFGALAQTATDLGKRLVAHGLGKGDHIAVMMANEPALVAGMYAIWSIGAVVVPVSARSTGQEASHLLAHARCRALLCDPARAEVAREAARAASVCALVCEPSPPLQPRVLHKRSMIVRRSGPPASESLAVITYTSGTTGSPKGVMVTHENVMWAAHACSAARGDDEETVGSCLSPLTHTPVFISHLLCRILHGSTAVLLEKFDTAAVLEAVERHAISDLTLIGGMVFDVTRLGSVPGAVQRSLRKVTVGGAATPMESKRALAEIFAGADVIEAYGQSESTDGVTMARGGSVFTHPGTVGRTNPHLAVAIMNATGQRAAVDEEGEIVVTGPTVMKGYYRNRSATAETVRDGWLHTGDLGRRDADGYFYITGRVKDLIITGGENVSPAEVEEVLRDHPGVADVAVIGTPHPRWGEQVTAIIVPAPGAALDDNTLSDYAGTRLAGFKKPRRIEFVDTLPRNALNKVQTGVLKERFGGKV
jgi:acyl-CoA synthetase (AMP-forming)/AMP-acid ligase II